MPDLIPAALDYLAAGHHLLALTGKRPNPRYHAKPEEDGVPGWSWDRSIYGLPESDEDIEAFKEVFTHPSTTGIALLIPEHVLVADVDSEPAAQLFRHLAGSDPLDTRTSKTPNGYHIWFLAPGADQSVWLGNRSLLFKGYGGYVAAPPSDHFDDEGNIDGTYAWIGDWEPIDWLPEGIDAYIKQMRENARPEPNKEDGRRLILKVTGAKPVSIFSDRVEWAMEWNLAGLASAIINAPEGNQNAMIAWAAMVAQEEGVPYDTAMAVLLDAALLGNHPRKRAVATIRGVYQRRGRGQ